MEERESERFLRCKRVNIDTQMPYCLLRYVFLSFPICYHISLLLLGKKEEVKEGGGITTSRCQKYP